MTSHTDVIAAFAAALVDFSVNHDRPDDTYVKLVFDTIANILYSLTYDTVEGVQYIQDADLHIT